MPFKQRWRSNQEDDGLAGSTDGGVQDLKGGLSGTSIEDYFANLLRVLPTELIIVFPILIELSKISSSPHIWMTISLFSGVAFIFLVRMSWMSLKNRSGIISCLFTSLIFLSWAWISGVEDFIPLPLWMDIAPQFVLVLSALFSPILMKKLGVD